MKKTVLTMLAFVGLITACSRVPISGRSQILLVPNGEVLALSSQQYRQFLDTSRVVNNSAAAEQVKRVGVRIRQAVEQYMNANGLGSRLEGFNWEYNLVQSPQVNAWCMPGGKIVVYSGILPITQTEAGLATVMGHEVAHAVAEHGRERMSESLVANGLISVGQAYTGSRAQQDRSTSGALLMQAIGASLPVAYQVGRALPHGRAQESEADHLGIIFMAIAGYNPQESTDFWQRMAKASGGKSQPAFLASHPSDQRRIADLRKLMPEAMTYYQRSAAGR